ncbi:G-protein coupled receptor dmsr-1-like [Planococcus citri]|uniref:G-protein coupled receptor dmsr-1-like n=1 Tax=Planococcus citri TaxID=170843 RepID=UPI0031F7806F
MIESDPLCGTGVYTFQRDFEEIYGYLSLTICLLGSVGNLLNVWVFTRKNMLSSMNVLLIGLTAADLVVLLVNIPYTLHQYLRPETFPYRDLYTYGWTLFSLCCINLQRVFHGISTWHTIMLAIWRYIAVAYPLKERIWCSMKNTYWAIAAGYLVYPFLHIPLYLTFAVTPVVELLDEDGFETDDCSAGCRNTTVYKIRLSYVAEKGFLKGVNFLMYSILFRLTPSVVLTAFSLRLIWALVESRKRRQNLISASTQEYARNMEKEKQMNRTTRMLLAVLILFLITEVPAGIFGFFSMIYGKKFYKDCYLQLVEIFDILTLIYSSITFAIYYIMSGQFRTTFKSLVCSLKCMEMVTGRNADLDEETTTTTTTTTTEIINLQSS